MSAVVLAGGKSSRFGEDKAFADYKGRTLIGSILSQLKDTFGEVTVISNKPEKLSSFSCNAVPDIFPGAGPLGGVYTGLKVSKSREVFITACDMPVVDAVLIREMLNMLCSAGTDAAVLSRNGFIEPFHAIYTSRLISPIESRLGKNGGGLFSFLRGISISTLDVDETSAVFTNINRKEDLI